MIDKRKEAIMWVKALIGEIEGTDLEYAGWYDIVPHKDYPDSPLSTDEKWGIEEGAIQMLRRLFDIKDEELYNSDEGDQ
ncbi:MAG: hypothetical protein U9O95_08165 [Candidatus Marinimicrobia bacterium]|nr:hypothetical protein [Candidatus Neomarinimicrobiota bacterium]